MKKLIGIFIGILIIAIMFIMLYLGGAIYNAGDMKNTRSVVFQPNDLSSNRIAKPIMVNDIGESVFRDRLFQKFMHEYFYVIPDAGDIARRKDSKGALRVLASGEVFDAWVKNTAEDLQSLASQNFMRQVNVLESYLPEDSDYWIISYELTTWDSPNDMNAEPTVVVGTAQLKLKRDSKNNEIDPRQIKARKSNGDAFDPMEYIRAGYNPAGIFSFQVIEVR